MVDPELDPSAAAAEGPALPPRGSDEFKPFIRRLPEFKFWSDPVSPPPDLSPLLARSAFLLLIITASAPAIRYATCMYLPTRVVRSGRLDKLLDSLSLSRLDGAVLIGISKTDWFPLLLKNYYSSATTEYWSVPSVNRHFCRPTVARQSPPGSPTESINERQSCSSFCCDRWEIGSWELLACREETQEARSAWSINDCFSQKKRAAEFLC